jgi:pimeloyl-ACP methyl ester carboxylesterase
VKKFTQYKNTQLHFSDEGNGPPVVFLHGYLESLDIWQPFTDKLMSRFRVIRIDIPGHGKSGIIEKIHTMDLMADAVIHILNELSVDKCVMVGHSMGGYVTLAVAENYPSFLLGFCLFHSSPFADTDEKKMNRDREMELVKQGKKDLIFNTNVPKVFANDNLFTLSDEVEKAKEIALQTPEEGIISILAGMKTRPDRSHVIQNFPGPVLWIFGKKDNHISYDAVKEKIETGPRGEVILLENSGHIGFIEEPDYSLHNLISFIDLCLH